MLSIPTAFVLTIYVAVTTPVQAEPIYSQVLPAEPTGAFGSQDTPNGQKIADSILIQGSEPVTIRSVRFIGGYGLRNPPPITPPLDALPADDFQIVFLEDVNGVPGPPISSGDFSVGPAFSRTPTGGQLLNGVLFPIEYVVNLGDGIVLSPASVYWFAITNDAGPAYGWAWARAFGLFDQRIAATFDVVVSGPWIDYPDGGMFFELNDHSLPEPSTLTVFLTGFVVSLFIRRRTVHSELHQDREHIQLGE
jgi:hypothetical protein